MSGHAKHDIEVLETQLGKADEELKKAMQVTEWGDPTCQRHDRKHELF